jgi:CRISPR/Cas system-associated protein Cas5 (RAMP superfamily)
MRKTKKSRVKIAPENNIELIFHRPFTKMDKPSLWHSGREKKNAIYESQMEEINEKGEAEYLEKNKKIIENRKSHSNKILVEYKTRKNLPYLAANEARVKKIAYDEDPGVIVLKRTPTHGGRTKKRGKR